jgi:hypothetical protein
MSQLVIKSTERKAPALQVDRSGDHLWGDVIDICRDGLSMEHCTPDPFLCINLPCERVDVEYLLEPLDGIYRKRYGLRLENLPEQKFSELCAIGITTVTVPILESIIECR